MAGSGVGHWFSAFDDHDGSVCLRAEAKPLHGVTRGAVRLQPVVLFSCLIPSCPAQNHSGHCNWRVADAVERRVLLLLRLYCSIEQNAVLSRMIFPQSTAYGWLMLAGIIVSLLLWS